MNNITKEEIHKLAIETAAKSPCQKRKVGAVLIAMDEDGTYIAATGYNHHPTEAICELPNGDTKNEVIHAEVHCLNNIPLNVLKDHRCTMYITHEPCNDCKTTLCASNIAYIVVGEFMKFDSDKPRMSLVPTSLVLGAAHALTYGAKKYKVNNWRKTTDIEGYLNAFERHYNAWKDGEEIDPESGLSHLDHLAANLVFIMELRGLPKIRKDTK